MLVTWRKIRCTQWINDLPIVFLVKICFEIWVKVTIWKSNLVEKFVLAFGEGSLMLTLSSSSQMEGLSPKLFI